jgi:predicted nucleotidyltransferase
MEHGLTKRDADTICGIFNKYPDIKLVHLFGSRAKGTFKPGSDIDMAIMNDGTAAETITRIRGEFEESSLPYSIDLVSFCDITSKELKQHILRVGIELYKRPV